MAKAIAVQVGYFGGELREEGARFNVPDEIWNNPKKRPRWARLDPSSVFGGKGDHDGDGYVGGSRPLSERVKTASTAKADTPKAIVVPADWKSRPAKERKALAVEIVGKPVANAAEADKVISAYVESTKPEVFGDAPAPQAAGNGMQQALADAGSITAPDWVDPSMSPQAVDD